MDKFEKQSNAIKQARELADKKITENIKSVFLIIGKEWQDNHPKRHLQLIAGMGCAFWTIDGSILHVDTLDNSSSWEGWKNYSNYDHDQQSQFADLVMAFDWLDKVLDRHEFYSNYLTDIDFKII